VIVSDHHLPGGPLPDCLAVINPRQTGCDYPDKDLAAAGIAFKIALALMKRLGGDENVVLSMLDLVAMATIADVAPLRGENRIFARYGLRLMAN
jgi:single-stranded-DNA-specific exonuclease